MKKKSRGVLSALLLSLVMLFASVTSVVAATPQLADRTPASTVTLVLFDESTFADREVVLAEGESLLQSFSLAGYEGVAFVVSAEVMAGIEAGALGEFFEYLMANYEKYAYTSINNDVLARLESMGVSPLFECPPHPLTPSYILRWVGHQPFAVPVWLCTICGRTWYR